jgi:excisionase family DNA binding protein
MITHDPEYYTVREAANALRVSVPTVWRWVRSGRLKAYRIGERVIRVRRSDLTAMITPADQPQVDVGALLERLTKADEAILARHGGRPFESSVPLIREARRARSERL